MGVLPGKISKSFPGMKNPSLLERLNSNKNGQRRVNRLYKNIKNGQLKSSD